MKGAPANRITRIAAILLALAIAVLGIAAPASAHEDATTTGHERVQHVVHHPHPKTPKQQHKRSSPQRAVAVRSAAAPAPTSTPGSAVAQADRTPGNGKAVGRRTTATSVTSTSAPSSGTSSSGTSSGAATSGAKASTATASSGAPTPRPSGAAANLVAPQPGTTTGPQLRVAPMDGGLLAPNDRASGGSLPPDASDRLGAAQLPFHSSRIGGINDTLALVLLLAGFAVAMAGIVSLAGHRGRRTR